MRYIGTQAKGIRLPIINRGDSLPAIVAEYVVKAVQADSSVLQEKDIIGITEAIVAKAQGNYATISQLATDISKKYPDGQVGVVFPILSRNRFINILKGIKQGADEVFILLSYPSDEVGNPIMNVENLDDVLDRLPKGPIPANKFREITGEFKHPFTGVDYIDLYESVGAKVYFSNDPRDILKLTPHALAADVHTRFLTQKRLLKAGAKTALTLSDILCQPVSDSGFNPDYGVLGSNISSDDRLKLFPRECNSFVVKVQDEVEKLVGVRPQVLVYGDGAFKDPVCGIWELADPVVSPGFTPGLMGQPEEIKMKMVADTRLAGMESKEQEKAIKEIIKQKSKETNASNEGTTPRRYVDLLGSLCDLVSGSGDKGTPVVLIQGYFDNFAD